VNSGPGAWGQGVEAAPPADATTGSRAQNAFINTVTCTTAGNCVATGNYNDTSGNSQLLIVTETDGVWAQGTELKPLLPTNAAATPYTYLQGVTCTSAGNCVAAGDYFDVNGNLQVLILSETHGVWAPGVEITLTANAATNPSASPGGAFATLIKFAALRESPPESSSQGIGTISYFLQTMCQLV
jgi:ferredoxin